MSEMITQRFTLTEKDRGLRLDQAIANHISTPSRSTLQTWMKSGEITVDGKLCKPKIKSKGREHIVIQGELKGVDENLAEDVPLDIIFEDESIIVINKPAGLVVHPGAGNPSGTMMNGLLAHDLNLSHMPRAGIVHRLDKDTSGLMVVAKTEEVRQYLIDQLKDHHVERTYIAVVHGVMISGMTIKGNIGRHPKNRLKMALVPDGFGKPALTHVRVIGKWDKFTMLEVSLETGRTHQIRVHLSAKYFPLVGDLTYGGRATLKPGISFNRQALHARGLSFTHPKTGEQVCFEAAIPQDLHSLIANLTAH